MSHHTSCKIAITSICLFFTFSIFAQESSSSSNSSTVQKEKLEAERYQLAAMNADMLNQQSKINAELLQAKDNLAKISGRPYKKGEPKDLKSKEISMEFPATKSADIYIENNRNLDIKVWEQPKVKIVTTVMYDGDSNKVSDAEWFEKMNFSFRTTANSVKIKVGANGNNFYIVNDHNVSWGGANFDFGNNLVAGQGKGKKSVVIYIPKENNIDIDSKYSELTIDGNLNKLNLDITNGGIDMGDVNKLFLRSKYSNVTVGNIKTAEVELINGRFIAKDAEDLDLDTKYATVEAGSVKKLMVRSTNDEYEMEEVGSITCRKNYGNLRITKLLNSLELDGTNADLKIRNIADAVESIKINDKYADIRLPMRNVKNYSVTYQGVYSTIYANFDKKPFIEKPDSKSTANSYTTTTDQKSSGIKTYTTTSDQKSSGVNTYTTTTDQKPVKVKSSNGISYSTVGSYVAESDEDNHFTATVGDGKGAKLDLKCQNCTVDFK